MNANLAAKIRLLLKPGEFPMSVGARVLLEETLRIAESGTPPEMRAVVARIQNAIAEANTNPTVVNGQILFDVQ